MADTDITVNESNANQIDIKVATANDFIITANKFEVQASSVIDMNGQELILDADGDTSITADTDDQIDFKIAGADDITMTATQFDINGKELILDADADTSITADTDDQIDIRIAGADDFQFTANKFTAAAGSGIVFTKTAAATELVPSGAWSDSYFTSNNYSIKHTLTIDVNFENNAELADIIITSDKCSASSNVIGTASADSGSYNSASDFLVRCHTVADCSFRSTITNKTGTQLTQDDTIVINYVILGG